MKEYSVRFEAGVVFDLPALREINAAYPALHKKNAYRQILLFILLFELVMLFLLDSGAFFTCMFIFIGYLYLIGRNIYAHVKLRALYKQILEKNGGTPPNEKTLFCEDDLCKRNLASGNEMHVSYEQICFIGKTDNFLLLFLDNKQYLPVRRDTLVGGTEDALVQYLMHKCSHLKSPALRVAKSRRWMDYLCAVAAVIGLLLAIYWLFHM